MGLRDLFKSKGGSKIKVQRYYNDENKELNLPEIAASINAVGKTGEFSTKFGNKKISSKITIPDGISSELVRLDQLQEQLANGINGLTGERRQDQLVKYTDVLMKMMDYQTTNDESLKKKVEGEFGNVKEKKNSELKKFLDDRNFKSTLLPDDLTKNKGFIIWPVTLLSKTTYIHKAQAQLIKLLVNCGWKLHVIIGDCGKQLSWKNDFTDNIKSVLVPLEIEIEQDTIAFLGDYYKQNESMSQPQLLSNVDSANILSFFHQISEGLKWSKFDRLIKKNYDNIKRTEIDGRTVLNNIQPLLIWSLVTAIVKVTNSKSILIAGEDEQDQWKYITDFTANKLSVIYIHELKKEGNMTMDQIDLKMESKEDMTNKLNVGNMAQWLFTHFVELPKFITSQKPSFCRISDNTCSSNNSNCIKCLFENDNFNNKDFDKIAFIDHIWPLANPANS